MRLWLGLICLSIAFCAETSLGGIELGQKYEDVIKRYPGLNRWAKGEQVNAPFPLSVNLKQPLQLVQAPPLELQCYFDDKKEVRAISVFLNKDNGKDHNVYETAQGLRPGDGIIELKLLYGLPLDLSEYAFKDAAGNKIYRRIYYYPNLCIQTYQQDDLPEYIDSILLGQYSAAALALKDQPLLPPVRR